MHVHNSYNAKICILFSKTEFRTFTEGNIDLNFTILAVCSDGPNILIIRHIATSPEDGKYRKIYAIDFASFRPIDPGDAGRAYPGDMRPEEGAVGIEIIHVSRSGIVTGISEDEISGRRIDIQTVA